MPDDRSDIYIDLSFFAEETASEDTGIDLKFFSDDNIGQKTLKVELRSSEPTEALEDLNLEYITTAAQEYAVSVSLAYEAVDGTADSQRDQEVNFSAGTAISGTIDLSNYYRAFNTSSGTIDKRVAYISGREYITEYSISTVYKVPTMLSGTSDYRANYTNFSGDYSEIGGLPVPYHDIDFDIIGTLQLARTATSGTVDTWLDLFFAGWVDYIINADVYSADHTLYTGPMLDVTAISGSVDVNYLELFSADLTVSGTVFDVYCALTDLADINCDVQTRDGRIAYNTYDVFSTKLSRPTVSFDVELFSLKITNFSLAENEFTEASGFISVDILDDTCPVSTSGTILLVDGVEVPTTLSGIDDGYRLYYDPVDNFESLNGPTTFTIHAENECGDTLEKDYYLTFGYVVEYDNKGFDYGYGNKVAVRLTAENMASCPKEESVAFIFETADYIQKNLGASIVCKPFAQSQEDMPASIYPQSTAYFYGKEFEVVVRARDFAGKEMEPFILRYKIEDAPS
jgi:hypothetical protein